MCHNDGDRRFVRDIHLSHGNPSRFSPRKAGSRILARGVHMSDGNAQEAQSLYVRQCIIHAFKRVRAVV